MSRGKERREEERRAEERSGEERRGAERGGEERRGAVRVSCHAIGRRCTRPSSDATSQSHGCACQMGKALA